MQEEVYTEADWKLFSKRVGGWQEDYMGRLLREYVELLEGEECPSKRFWALDKRLKQDKRKAGVYLEMRRSRLHSNVVQLMLEGAIGPEDLEGFSETFREAVERSVRMFRELE